MAVARKRDRGITPLPDGGWRVVARVRVDGRIVARRRTIRGTKEEARELFAELKREAREGVTSNARSLTVPHTFGELLSTYAGKRAFSPSHTRKIDQLTDELGNVLLAEFPERFERYIALLRVTPAKGRDTPRSPASTNRLVEIARAAHNMAVELGWVKVNPITKARFPKLKEVPRDVALTADDEQRLLNCAAKHAPHLEPMLRFALAVPCRRSELVNMRREDLDLIHNTIRVRNGSTKNDQGTWKPIPPSMVDYFRTLPEDTEYLFFRRDQDGKARHLGDPHSAWRTLRRKAKLQHIRLHDTRHHSATAMVDAGTPEQVVMTVAGWRTNMLRTYYHRNPRRALDLVRWGGKQPSDRDASQDASQTLHIYGEKGGKRGQNAASG